MASAAVEVAGDEVSARWLADVKNRTNTARRRSNSGGVPEKYIQDLLARATLGDERTVDTPMELNVKLRPTDGDPLPDPTRYHHLVGSLVYLAVTSPDISYPVHILS
ncbi:hypothetical protein QYE76_026552 [Lolium multiflorum]|uniref:Uncharacterized protein n=1 Tax=Lolium multiflorum TaxID=4521 RepID=A0AAD8VXP2_LOLMU|nr:hypothetical protein QYE76_026552 [Lolium multiflorum]